MKVGIDAHMVGGQETGNETYVRGLVDGLGAISAPIDLVVFHVNSPWTSPEGRVRFERLTTDSPYVRLGIELPVRSLTDRLDVLHMTYAAPLWAPARIVLTVHDICYATHPEWFSPRDVRVLSSVVPRSIKQSAHVITVSDAARREIIERYRVPEEKITVIPNGPGRGAQPISAEEARLEVSTLGLGGPYLLTVGNLQPRKNLPRLIEAFHRSHLDLDLVIVGPKHYRADEVIRAATSDPTRIHFTGYVTDRRLAALYRCSTGFVLPSLYEGFGLPAIEAMSHGVPVACSNAGALPEVCGDAAVLFDPLSVEDMAAALEQIAGDVSVRQRLAKAGRARAATFSWETTARQTVRVYEKALQ